VETNSGEQLVLSGYVRPPNLPDGATTRRLFWMSSSQIEDDMQPHNGVRAIKAELRIPFGFSHSVKRSAEMNSQVVGLTSTFAAKTSLGF
jgi:hypothetical protein